MGTPGGLNYRNSLILSLPQLIAFLDRKTLVWESLDVRNSSNVKKHTGFLVVVVREVFILPYYPLHRKCDENRPRA